MFGWTPVVPRPQEPGARAIDWPGLGRARAEAARRGDRFVGTQHLLLALISGGDVRDVLAAAGVDPASVEAALAGIRGSGAFVAPVGVGAVGLSSRASAVLATAAAHRTAGRAMTDHDVLAALLDSDDPAVGRLVLGYIGARGRIRDALTRARPA